MRFYKATFIFCKLKFTAEYYPDFKYPNLGSHINMSRRYPSQKRYDDYHPTVSFRLPAQLKEELEKRLQKKGISKSEFFRILSWQFVNGDIDVLYE